MQPKKGDTIWVIENTGTLERIVRRVVVKSWGPKQATFADATHGNYVRYRGYTDDFPFALDAEGAKGLAEVDIEREREIYRSRLGNDSFVQELVKRTVDQPASITVSN